MELKVGVADIARHASGTVGVYMVDNECRTGPLGRRKQLGLHQPLVPI